MLCFCIKLRKTHRKVKFLSYIQKPFLVKFWEKLLTSLCNILKLCLTTLFSLSPPPGTFNCKNRVYVTGCWIQKFLLLICYLKIQIQRMVHIEMWLFQHVVTEHGLLYELRNYFEFWDRIF